MIEHLVYLYEFNLKYAEKLVEDVSIEQMSAQPSGLINHPAWTLGHLGVSADHLGQLLGLQSELAESWRESFKTGGEPSGNPLVYPTKKDLLGTLKVQHERNTVAIQKTSASRFAETHPDEKMRDYFPTVGDMIIFMMTSHEMSHLGQIAAWRRAMGLGSAT